MDMGVFRGLVTVVLLLLFVGILIWSFSGKRHADFDAASRMPLGDDSQPPKQDSKGSMQP